ncbi:MAG: phosphatidylserine decarboxylase, partial [Bdellovibrionales bacterium]|nr:phosphatidylserine decarboxylase [Bdellovibrionales bacterium]
MYKLLYFVPKNLLSYIVGFLAEIPWPYTINHYLKKWFVKRYHIDMGEAEHPLDSYASLGQLFTRKLKPGKRPIAEGFVHPCDGKLTQGGIILKGQLVQAKGKNYSIHKFLAEQQGWQDFEGGHYLTYYLCPTDYHRVHFPCSGEVLSCTHVPGRLWPVNPWSVENISQLFSVNERTLTLVETEKGKVMIVMVGATNVGKISMSFDQDIVTNHSHFRQLKTKKYSPPI